MIKNGALKILHIAGVDVYLHWTWILFIYVLSYGTSSNYHNKAFAVPEIAGYILLIAMHETVQLIVGRMTGGRASEMYLAFLGRSTNLELPQRPWPIIITYSAGILAYVMTLGGAIAFYLNAPALGHDVTRLSLGLVAINIILLIWTAAPVYPLDGGKIFQAVLWLFISRKRSLQIACIVGMPISLAIVAYSGYMFLTYGGLYFLYILFAGMMFFACLSGFRQAKVFDLIDKMPRRDDVACPHCKQHPFTFTQIICPCGAQLDPFLTRGLCDTCGSATAIMACPLCSQRSPIHKWFSDNQGFTVEPATTGPMPPVMAQPEPAKLTGTPSQLNDQK